MKTTKKDPSRSDQDGIDATVSDSVEVDSDATRPPSKQMPKEIGGPAGPEPTRYGDWERNGRCSDF